MVYTISRDIHLVSGGSPTYNIPFAFRINIHQQTDVEQSPFQQLLGAVLNLVKRHEALRTVLLGPRAGLDGFSLNTWKKHEKPRNPMVYHHRPHWKLPVWGIRILGESPWKVKWRRLKAVGFRSESSTLKTWIFQNQCHWGRHSCDSLTRWHWVWFYFCSLVDIYAPLRFLASNKSVLLGICSTTFFLWRLFTLSRSPIRALEV